PTDTETGTSPTGGQITVTVTGGTIESFSIITNFSNVPENGTTPHGGISFTANLAQGQTSITVTVTFPNIPPGARFYKLVNGQYIDITGQVQISGNTITLTVADNSSLDANGQSGVVSDPIVLVVPQQQQGGQQPPAQQGGGGGGCSMGAGASPVNSLLWLLVPVLVLARRVRKNF
ncbi:MAG: choice-of-anchor U domain-containing protein, partial [Aquificaceae bacterium]|nr:choice-of-anchor U domain-containing protein [Aquificaceae bacterium]